MSEVNTEVSGNENVDASTPEYTEIEQQAIEMGWVPKDEYTGDPKRWKPAEVFVALDEPIKRIESQSRELKALRQSLDSLKTHYSKVQETEFKRAIAALKAERKQALVDGDIDKFDALDERIDEARQEVEQLKNVPEDTVQAEPVIHPEFHAWINRNPWYASYGHMKKFADDVGLQLAATGIPRAEVLKKVEEAVRKEFPNKFVNPNKEKAQTVEAGSGRGSKSGKSDDIELTEMEKKIMNDLVRGGHITKEKYISDLKKTKGLN